MRRLRTAMRAGGAMRRAAAFLKRPGGPQAASAARAPEPRKPGGGPEGPGSPAGPATGAAVSRKDRLRRLLGRPRRPAFRARPRNGPDPAPPANVRPWTGEILPHVSETRGDGPLARVMDRIAWHATLPDGRHVLHAERRRRRRESLAARALVRFAAALAGRAPGPPPWLATGREREEP